MSEEFLGTSLVIEGPVKWIGDPKENPKNNCVFQIWENVVREIFGNVNKPTTNATVR